MEWPDIPPPWWAHGPLRPIWIERQERAHPVFWLKGAAPCSGPQWHNIRSNNVCAWCGLSMAELVLVGLLREGPFARGEGACPICKTSQLLMPDPKDIEKNRLAPHSISHRKCKGSGQSFG